MNTIPEFQPNSLPEFLEIIEKLQNKCVDNLWFRGCGKKEYLLLPSLYRHEKIKTINELAKLEQDLMNRFRQRSIPYHDKDLTDDWRTLFFMQHYRIPTRLLDWTENPLIALHFALMSAPFNNTKSGDLVFLNDSCIWVLDPCKWNRSALKHLSYSGGVLITDDDILNNGYKPSHSFSQFSPFPVALYGEHNSPRIVAQQGVFTVFGQEIQPMEKIHIREGFVPKSLTKIIIKGNVIFSIRKSLLRQGVTESVVFPDLEGLALEIKRTYGFYY